MTLSSSNNIIIHLLSKEGKAKNAKILNEMNNNIQTSISSTHLDNIISKGTIVKVNVSNNTSSLVYSRDIITFKFTFEDDEGNKYYQIIDGNFHSGFTIHETEGFSNL